jgi:hypothetical protein
VSQSSPASGHETKADADSEIPYREEDPDRSPQGPVEIELETSRQRVISWTIFGIVFGALLVWKLGTVGVWAGYVLIAIGLYRAYELAMSFVHPAGKIVVSEKKVILPRGIHRAHPLTVEPSAVSAVYFLRRSVPWNRSAPVLVVELGSRTMMFERDWFASEADQRHVVHALLALLPPEKPAEADKPARERNAERANETGEAELPRAVARDRKHDD